jgi:hypothetical protein
MSNQVYQQGGYQPPTQYNNINSAPLIANSVPPMTTNQATPSQAEVENLRLALKSSPQFVNCPYCKTQGMTRTEQACSIPSILCCFCFGGIPWLLCQACRGKDINCYDAQHYCVRCNSNLSSYQAC